MISWNQITRYHSSPVTITQLHRLISLLIQQVDRASYTASRPEKTLSMRTYVAFPPKARLYIIRGFGGFRAYVLTAIGYLARRKEAVAELRPLKPAKIRRNGLGQS
jgi:hypothetical protein